MVEIVVRDLQTSLDWYQALGLSLERLDQARGFALLHDGRGGRVALKLGTPERTQTMLHFEVDQLPPGPVKVSDEGYEQVVLYDPDGWRVGLFRWVDQKSRESRKA